MAKKIKLIVSDFHLGKGCFLKDGTANILEDFQFASKFVEFLKFYSSDDHKEAHVELIINGDFLNLLQGDYLGVHSYLITEKKTNYMLHSIIAGHPEVFQALKYFMEQPNHEIAYVIGNHDQALLFPAPRRILCDYIGKDLRFYDTYYEFSGVHIEHGHQYESVNKCDIQNYEIRDPMYPEPVLNLPWASLFVAGYLPKMKKKRPYVDKIKPFTSYIRWALIHDFFFAIYMIIYSCTTFLKMSLLQSKYPLLDFHLTLERLKGLTLYPSFVNIARKLLQRKKQLHTVIFSHTHVLRYRQWAGGLEYFNVGTWNEFTNLDIGNFGLQHFLTYGYIEQEDNQKPRTSLKEWKGSWEPSVEASSVPNIPSGKTPF